MAGKCHQNHRKPGRTKQPPSKTSGDVRRGGSGAEKGADKYRDLFDNAPIGILQPTVDSRLRLQPADVDRMRQPTPFQDRKE
jgi:hypothetical protein